MARITRGRLQLDFAPAELNAVAKEAVETCAPIINERRHTLHLMVSPQPVCLHAEAARLVQFVCHLLTNAAKYTRERGRTTLAITVEEHAAVIRVRDDGVGIPQQMLDKIFAPYVQIGSSRRRSEGGLGTASPREGGRRAARRNGRGPQRGHRRGLRVHRPPAGGG